MANVTETRSPGAAPATPDLPRASDGLGVFRAAMRMVAEKIPPRALGWLWTIHAIHGDQLCAAHKAGGECCVDILLENCSQLREPTTGSVLVDILRAGYDVIVESSGDDRNGPVDIFLSYQNQPPLDDMKITVPLALIDHALDRARRTAVTFPVTTPGSPKGIIP